MPNVQTHPHHQNGGNRQKFQCNLRPLNVAVLSMVTCCFLNEDVTNKLVSELDFTICQPGFFAVSLLYMEKSHLISSCFWIFPVAQNCPQPKSLTLTLPSNYLTHRRFFTSVRNQAVTSLLASCSNFAASPFWVRLASLPYFTPMVS